MGQDEPVRTARKLRVILDTNVLIAALLTPVGAPWEVYSAWIEGAFTLLISEEQIMELRHTLAKPALSARIRPHHAGRLVNNLRNMAEMIAPLPRVERSDDPTDNFLLAMAEAGEADYLVTGDKGGLLVLRRHGGTRILSVREFAEPID